MSIGFATAIANCLHFHVSYVTKIDFMNYAFFQAVSCMVASVGSPLTSLFKNVHDPVAKTSPTQGVTWL